MAEFGIDEVTNDFPLKRCVNALGDPCRAGSGIPNDCYDFLMTHGPGWAMKPVKRFFDRFMPNLGFPGMGVTEREARRRLLKDSGIPRSWDMKQVKPPHWKGGDKRYKQFLLTNPTTGKSKLLTKHPADANHAKPHWHLADPRLDSGDLVKNNHGLFDYRSDGTALAFDP